jgi:hypothetical protein
LSSSSCQAAGIPRLFLAHVVKDAVVISAVSCQEQSARDKLLLLSLSEQVCSFWSCSIEIEAWALTDDEHFVSASEPLMISLSSSSKEHLSLEADAGSSLLQRRLAAVGAIDLDTGALI